MTRNKSLARLPDAFASLQPFVERWSVAGLADRAAARDAATQVDQVAFYEAARDRIDSILDYLDARPLATLDSGEAALLNLALSFIHVALSIELQGDAEPRHTGMREHMRISREPAEPWNTAHQA